MSGGFAEILKGLDKSRDRKFAAKLPQWAAADEALPVGDHIEIPSSLNLEQCSSCAAALYKAGLLRTEFPLDSACRLADLTGGLGVDSWAFSQVSSRVYYNEAVPELAEAAGRNFRRLGCDSVEVHCGDAADALSVGGPLREFAPDVIYLDPARRSDSGRKVFLLEDCRPNVLELLPSMFEIAPFVMVKLSPMADLSMLIRRFGSGLRCIHVVQYGGEVKELLAVLDNSGDGFSECSFKVVAIDRDGAVSTLDFEYSSENRSSAVYPSGNGVAAESGKYLFEPGAALLKAGVFKCLCGRFGLVKLAPSTHLYLCETPVSELEAFGRFFRIDSVKDFDNKVFRAVAAGRLQAEAVARNVPMTSEQLRSRLALRPGGDRYVFAVSVLCDGEESRRLVFATKI